VPLVTKHVASYPGTLEDESEKVQRCKSCVPEGLLDYHCSATTMRYVSECTEHVVLAENLAYMTSLKSPNHYDAAIICCPYWHSQGLYSFQPN